METNNAAETPRAMLEKFLYGKITYDQALSYEKTLEYSEAISFHGALCLLAFVGKKIKESNEKQN